MKNSSADILEFEALRQVVGRYVSSPMGRERLDAIQPSTDRERIVEDLADAGEAMAYLQAAAHPEAGSGRGGAIRLNFGGIPDLTEAVHKLRIEGASLEPREIFDLAAILDRAADARSILAAAQPRFPRLGARAERIAEFRPLLEDLHGKFNPDGTVADHASVALHRIRRDIERQKRAIQASLERFLRQHSEEGVLQEEFVAIRNERFVVPVIAGQRRRIDGVIHGASASGHTLFIEPLETIELNNDLVRLGEDELREVHRILREMTARMRVYAPAIRDALEVLAELELIFAKARFGLEFDCAVPRFSADADRRLRLKDARHPLLEDVLRRRKHKVVPLSLELHAGCRTLLISGPNTGGKTVSMKTVGLLALMAHAALPVPAAEAEFPIFDQVLADIGDKQSIEESLSTFSAHISHIREMILDASADSLVLLDEIGSATDPEEGGALGVAIVDHFRQAGAFTLVSTHLTALKVYGAGTDTVLNASMGFDEATLAPTYKLHVGAPGKSAGLDIAARLGMPDYIMQRAREALTGRDRDVSLFLAELHRRLGELETQQKELRQKEVELAERERRLAREWEKKENEKLRELERRTDAMLARFEEQSRETISQILQTAEQRKAAEQAQRRISKVKRELREEFQATVLETKEDARQGEIRRLRVEEGVRVRLKGIREPARVRRKLGDDRIEVEAGFMKLQVPLEDVIEVLPDAPQGNRLPSNVSYRPAPELAPLHQEINVIGKRADEAIEAVDEFLDRAVMATASRVRIVHGHGMGILKKAVSDLLAKHPHVQKFYPAPQQEGGAGATIVELRD